MNLKSLKNFEDVATMLNVTKEELKDIIVYNKRKNYTEFEILKKNGSKRKIHKPSDSLMVIQIKLKNIIYENFSSHINAHGFVPEKDILTNAQIHIDRKYIINLDLENFFKNISYGRVSNMFIRYFKLNLKVAYTLANICCHPDGYLPQGAPTSPIVSNIIAKTMDKDLTSYVRKMPTARYSRYADDITLSSNLPFTSQIMEYKSELPVLSTHLTKIITDNGFIINNDKVRFQRYTEHQEVTGITVNKKLNVRRTYIRRIRAMLHSLEQNIDNLDIPIQKFKEQYPFRNKKYSDKIDMFKVLKGMITHLGHVKGSTDSVFIKLALRFNKLVVDISRTKIKPIKIVLSNNFYDDNVFIVDSGDNDIFYFDKKSNMLDTAYGQGTAFYLQGVGLITNYHVLEYVIDLIELGMNIIGKEYNIRYFKWNSYQVSYFAKIIYYDIEKDIVILEPENIDINNVGIIASNESIKKDDFVRLLGFPEYSYNDEIKITDGNIDRKVHYKKNIRYEISQNIFEGNSGGPVVNSKDEAVGIAVRGTSVPPQIIPIEEIKTLISEKEKK